ncbi:MAG: hypothetical protein M1825_003329 [Sarcosagium campestre]|nr:MAG: hypothetical protein M1825_003329 [Sarcosagium campestre]
MLAAIPASDPYYNQYTPFCPSPLSPRHANATRTPSSMPKSARFNTRPHLPMKPNPLLASVADPDRASRRRERYLDSVRRGREARRWEARGGDDEILRTIDDAEHKRWEDALRRDAENLAMTEMLQEEDDEQENYDMVSLEQGGPESLDSVLMLEEADIDSLVQGYAMEMQVSRVGDDGTSLSVGRESSPQNWSGFGSDDDDYDALLLEVLEAERQVKQQQQQQQQQQQHQSQQNIDTMDTSHG